MLVRSTNLSQKSFHSVDWGQGSRGCWSGGGPGGGESSNQYCDNTYYVTISTLSNAVFFGDITYNMWRCAGTSGGGRGLICGGVNHQTPKENISYHNIAARSDSTHFGNCTTQRALCTAASNGIKAIIISGSSANHHTPHLTSIDYVTIASAANATNFGYTINNPVKSDGTGNGVYGMTLTETGTYDSNKFHYVAIDTPANTTEFGQVRGSGGFRGEGGIANSNGSRAIWSGGYDGSDLRHMDYLTWSTPSNSLAYGQLRRNEAHTSGCEDGSRGMIGGGDGWGNGTNDASLEYFSMDLSAGSSVISAAFGAGTSLGHGSGHSKRQKPAAYAG